MGQISRNVLELPRTLLLLLLTSSVPGTPEIEKEAAHLTRLQESLYLEVLAGHERWLSTVLVTSVAMIRPP